MGVQSKKGARISASRLTNYISENEEGGLEAVGRGAAGGGGCVGEEGACDDEQQGFIFNFVR
jgi:hypothetical protein